MLKRLRSGSHKNSTYTAFREVGRVIRTVQLLRYLSDAPLRRRVTAATNKVESFNRFSQWVGFGNQGVLADNDPIEQEKTMKFNALLTNAVIFHNAWISQRSSASSFRRDGRSTRKTWPTSRRT
ncbi:Tn3 family transposase [Streptomyces sp. NBC_00236]|uniref:Tn3 family transposase n=1 Tax=Streptomyces sp. NPDC005773 TaxID=3364727 RepID=UPI002E292CE4|nr:Tn3 family transposase [Streptomyces sp. NBC_00236]